MDSTRLDLDKSLNTDLHLNSHESLNQTPEEEFQTKTLNPRKPSVNEELSLLVEKLKRAKEENKRLKELLVLTFEEHKSWQNQMMDYLLSNKADEQGLAGVPFAAPNKQKSKSIHDNNNDVNQGKSQNCSSDDGSCNKRIKEDIKAKIPRINAKTNAPQNISILRFWCKKVQKVDLFPLCFLLLRNTPSSSGVRPVSKLNNKGPRPTLIRLGSDFTQM